jgi:putative membrane protein
MMPGYWGWGSITWLGWIIWLVIIASIIWLVASLVGRSRRGDNKLHSTESPMEILKKRYAKGEINKEQFEQMKRDLGS